MPLVPPPDSASKQLAVPPTRAGQIAYYANVFRQLPGTYQGNLKGYKGLTWSALFTRLANQNPTADLIQLGDAVLGVEAAQKFGQSIGAVDTQLGKFVIDTGQAARKVGDTPIGHAAGAVDNTVSAAEAAIKSVPDFLQGLTSANLWIRVAKITIGGVILIVGLMKLTGTDKAVGGFAAKAVKVAPLL